MVNAESRASSFATLIAGLSMSACTSGIGEVAAEKLAEMGTRIVLDRAATGRWRGFARKRPALPTRFRQRPPDSTSTARTGHGQG